MSYQSFAKKNPFRTGFDNDGISMFHDYSNNSSEKNRTDQKTGKVLVKKKFSQQFPPVQGWDRLKPRETDPENQANNGSVDEVKLYGNSYPYRNQLFAS